MKIKLFFKLSFLLLLVVAVQTAFSQDNKKIIEFDDIFKNRTFYSPGIRGFNSMNDGIHYTAFDYKTQQIVKKRFDNDELVDVLFDIGKFKEQIAYVGTYSFNKNEDKLLLASDIEMIYRRSYKANFYIYDIKKNTLEKLSENGKQQLATFSPDGNKVAFVRDNNLFYKNIDTGKEFQITNDGERNAIINGAPDWVYEEEFEFSRAFDWSPNSENIAWIRFDESDVPEFSMYMYQGQNPSLDEYKLYPGMQTFKYPKAGDPNSLVSVKVYNIKSGKVTNVDVG
ncbi:MAG: DPP IV N-terminal domain-containing protein, partial [Lentimicrobiaceae bacterium]|nr:DPP IV N-terminal domain-containing protein [Lentimicrobiaceae bacterium]